MLHLKAEFGLTTFCLLVGDFHFSSFVLLVILQCFCLLLLLLQRHLHKKICAEFISTSGLKGVAPENKEFSGFIEFRMFFYEEYCKNK